MRAAARRTGVGGGKELSGIAATGGPLFLPPLRRERGRKLVRSPANERGGEQRGSTGARGGGARGRRLPPFALAPVARGASGAAPPRGCARACAFVAALRLSVSSFSWLGRWLKMMVGQRVCNTMMSKLERGATNKNGNADNLTLVFSLGLQSQPGPSWPSASSQLSISSEEMFINQLTTDLRHQPALQTHTGSSHLFGPS